MGEHERVGVARGAGSYASTVAGLERWELCRGDPGYPPALLDLEGETPVLRGYGDPTVLLEDCVSVIGARRANPYGITCARMAGRVAAECGVVVVSGGAVGCDQTAGTAALDAGGKTVVIPGCGADVVYPASSEDLYCRAVREGGCVLSIERWGTRPARYTFVRRNRVIAAFSASLIVCEAGRPSGTFSTATTAAELGRRVYAVPGSIFSANSQGTNWLIENGASIVTDEAALESLIALDYGRLRLASDVRSESRGELLDALVASPMTVDEIARFLRVELPQALVLLAEQEALGLVCRLPDARFAPTQQALLGQNETLGKQARR